MIAVDTNVLLRYLLEPLDKCKPQWRVIMARQVIDKAKSVFVSDIALAEMEWVIATTLKPPH